MEIVLPDQNAVEMVVVEAAENCRRCGTCCSRYNVSMNYFEARRIADSLGLKIDTFLRDYTSQEILGEQRFHIKRVEGKCIFLKAPAGQPLTTCSVHAARPQNCRDWTPSIYRRDCLEGLQKQADAIEKPMFLNQS